MLSLFSSAKKLCNDIYETCSDKAKCQFGHSELLISAESATKELQFNISFKTAKGLHCMYSVIGVSVYTYIPLCYTTKVKLWPLKVG